MTYRAMRFRLFIVGAVLIGALGISLAEYLPRFWPQLNLVRFLSDYFPARFSDLTISTQTAPSNGTFVSQNATLIALIAGAYSAYCLQQRGKFIDELRDWWNDMVRAKSEFLIYCESERGDEAAFLEAFYKLSTAMDTVRLIYSNINHTPRNPKG